MPFSDGATNLLTNAKLRMENIYLDTRQDLVIVKRALHTAHSWQELHPW
jgi:hypothetical protein